MQIKTCCLGLKSQLDSQANAEKQMGSLKLFNFLQPYANLYRLTDNFKIS